MPYYLSASSTSPHTWMIDSVRSDVVANDKCVWRETRAAWLQNKPVLDRFLETKKKEWSYIQVFIIWEIPVWLLSVTLLYSVPTYIFEPEALIPSLSHSAIKVHQIHSHSLQPVVNCLLMAARYLLLNLNGTHCRTKPTRRCFFVPFGSTCLWLFQVIVDDGLWSECAWGEQKKIQTGLI